MDATLSLGLPRMNQSGTLLEGIALWGELKPLLTVEAVMERALRYCDLAVSKGLLAIRTHVDICDDRLTAVDALLEVKQTDRALYRPAARRLPAGRLLPLAERRRKISSGRSTRASTWSAASRISSAPWPTGAASLKALCEIAEKRGLLVDIHCDETDDPLSRHIEALAYETQRLGLQGRVAGSHLTSMHSMDNYYVSKLLPLIAEAGVHADPQPADQHRAAGPPRHLSEAPRHDARAGDARHGINVAFGQDCTMDPWYSLGGADMLDVAHMGLHVGAADEPRGDALLLRGGDDEPGEGHASRRLRPRGRQQRRHGGAAGAGPDRGDPAARPPALRHPPRQGDRRDARPSARRSTCRAGRKALDPADYFPKSVKKATVNVTLKEPDSRFGKHFCERHASLQVGLQHGGAAIDASVSRLRSTLVACAPAHSALPLRLSA